MATFLIANSQFGRAGIIRKNSRPFGSVQDMNEELVQRWNAVVSENDIVIHLGNFAWDPTTAEEMFNELNFKQLLLVPAEHDQPVFEMMESQMLPENVKIINRIFEQPNHNSTFSYWPMLEWPMKDKGHYLFYGYYGKKYKPDHKKKMINMATEFWNYTPQDLNSLMRLFEDKDFNA
jgi:calcineurin-like phosphoesterase family protein|tara:strand:+ start:128 stop:658 length:531 start_codon:yes stop_codon:yes gene_type:complete